MNNSTTRREVAIRLTLALYALAIASGTGFATPSGLNNIPTADVVSPHVLVAQTFADFGESRGPTWFAGFKYGPSQNWEVGLDDTLAGSGSAGGPTLQAKCRVARKGQGALALGAANMSDDRGRHGDVFPYAVISAPLSAARGHLGYSWQSNNAAWFIGADAPVNQKLTLRADWIQTADGEESLSSLGIITSLSPSWLVEGWASFPTADDAKTGYIFKLDWVIPLPGK